MLHIASAVGHGILLLTSPPPFIHVTQTTQLNVSGSAAPGDISFQVAAAAGGGGAQNPKELIWRSCRPVLAATCGQPSPFVHQEYKVFEVDA